MPRRTIMTPTFVAKAVAEMKKEGATHLTVARKLSCSPSSIMRATGGKKAVHMGKRSKYLDKVIPLPVVSARKQATKKARNTKARKARAAARGAPKGLTKRKLTPKVA